METPLQGGSDTNGALSPGGQGPSPAARLAGVRAYTTALRPQPIDLKLDANEGPEPPEFLSQWLGDRPGRVLRAYPDPARFEAFLADRLGVEPDRLIVTAGADDALGRLCSAALDPDRAAVLTTPTFEMIPRYVRLAGAETLAVPWLGGPFPVADLESAATSTNPGALFVVTPSSPGGEVASADDLRRLSAAAPDAVLVVDLAYTEYADEDLTPAVLELPNAVAVRTLSKAWGLAGLRVGYAIGPEPVIAWLRAAGHPYAVSGPSLAIAQDWLEAGEHRTHEAIRRVRAERIALSAELGELGADPIESQANFVLARFERARQRASTVADLLAGAGIAVRSFAAPEPLSDALRITCPGDKDAYERLARALRTAMHPRRLAVDPGTGDFAPLAERLAEGVTGPLTEAETGDGAWVITADPDAIARARAAGAIPIGWDPQGSRAEDLLRAGAARVVRTAAELAEILP